MIDDGHTDGITEMQFARFLQVQNKAFGEDVAQQTEIMRFIDTIYTENVWIIKAQFYFFLAGFIVPFQMQMQPAGTFSKETVISLNWMCMITL